MHGLMKTDMATGQCMQALPMEVWNSWCAYEYMINAGVNAKNQECIMHACSKGQTLRSQRLPKQLGESV